MKLTRPVFVLFLLQIISMYAKADKLKDGFERLWIYDYFRAKEYFEEAIEKKTPGAAFGLSKIYSQNNNPFYNLDSARKYVMLADSSIHAIKPKELPYYSSFGVSDTTISLLNNEICKKAFMEAYHADSLEKYEHFISNFYGCEMHDSVIQLRNAVAFRITRLENSSAGYKNFMVKFPMAKESAEASDLYQQRIFEEQTADMKIPSYEKFMKDFPESPYVDEAERMIYQLSTAHRTIREYAAFARKYASSKFSAESWRLVYSLSMKDFSETAFETFKRNYPDYPFANELESDYKLQNYFFLPVVRDEKWGYQNENGEQMIEPKYEEVSLFSEGLAFVMDSGKYGYINKQGKVVIPFQFADAEAFHNGCAVVMKDSLYGLINRRGEFMIQPKYDDLSSPSQELCVAVKDDRHAYLLKNGKQLTGFMFDVAGDFKNGFAIVSLNEKFGLLNSAGKYAIEPEYEELIYISTNLLKASKNGKWGVITDHGKIVLPFEYDAIGEFSQHLALIAQNGKCGYVNEKGEIAIPMKFAYTPSLLNTGQFNGGYVLMKVKTKHQVIDTLGAVLPVAGFEDIRLPSFGLMPVKKNKNWGYANLSGKIVVPCKYEDAQSYENGFALIREKGLYGMLDTTGKTIVAPLYDGIAQKSQNFIVKKNNLYGMLNSSGNLVLPCIYTNIEFLSPTIIKVSEEEKFSYINLATPKQ